MIGHGRLPFPVVSLLALGTALAGNAHAQQAAPDPSSWPAYFDGFKANGPYAWLDTAAAFNADPTLANAVPGGQDGQRKLFVCRARNSQDGGIHPGKLIDRQCNIGWGGNEVRVLQGYEILTNTTPGLARYLTQQWVAPATPGANTFVGGSVQNVPMRVCRAAYQGGVHPGKEWQGKCLIGWGGKEIAAAPYEVLSLGFDKAAWLTTGATTVTVNSSGNPGTNGVITVQLQKPDAPLSKLQVEKPSDVYVAMAWQPGSLGKGYENLTTYSGSFLRKAVDSSYEKMRQAGKSPSQTADQLIVAVKKGDAVAQATLTLMLIEAAGDILNKAPATWTADERNFILYLQTVATDQRQRAVNNAMAHFREWELAETNRRATGDGVFALFDPLVNPPPEFLAQAQAGYAVSPETAANFLGVLGAMDIPISIGVGAASFGIIASTGASGMMSLAAVVVPSAKISASLAIRAGLSAIPRLLPVAGSAAAGVAVVALMVQAAVMKGIEVFKYEDYKVALNKAFNDAKATITADDLRALLKTEEGVKKVTFWLTAQAATGTNSATIPPPSAASDPWMKLSPNVPAVDIAAGPGNSLWLVGGDKVPGGYRIYRRDWQNQAWEAMPGGAVRIDVDPSGGAWVVNDAGEIWRWENKTWSKKFEAGTAKDIGIGANGALWIIGTATAKEGGGYVIQRWNAGQKQWDTMPGGAVRIDVDLRGNAWVVNNANAIFRWDGSTFVQTPGKGIDIGAGADGSVFVVGDNGTVHKWNGSTWIQRPGTLHGISVDGTGAPVGFYNGNEKSIWRGYP